MVLSSHQYAPIDLHCHSNLSDGVLSPAALVSRAAANGTQLLSLTDHDCIDGLDEARHKAEVLNLFFLNGIEISVSWRNNVTIHIVGLDIDPSYTPLIQGIIATRSGRLERLERMHHELSKAGIHGVYEGALSHANNPLLVGRAHVARYLVQIGLFKNMHAVFNYYLVPGKPGYVPYRWATLTQAISWIRGAGGIAVLAHPGRYRLTPALMKSLLEDFSAAGGIALEAGSASHSLDEMMHYVNYAKSFGFEVSAGSDFHSPSEDAVEVGFSPLLPSSCTCVAQRWLP